MILFLILIVIASIAIGFFILVQNPKGGGLAGNIAGFNTQFMGVKQTTDVLEKGTWVLAFVIAALCILSAIFIPTSATIDTRGEGAKPGTTNTAPATNPTPPVIPPQQP
ncbi:MAG: preprotein translocase subunit SecG [Chitinophagaceae bacterium]|nr:preprotein translocase subunit SecG [Chitinophagaceae bacterium]